MVSLAFTVFLVSCFTLLLLMLVVKKERRLGRRFFAAAFRDWLDGVVYQIECGIVDSWGHFVRYILQLHWYYSIHSVLRTILQMIVAAYSYFEDMFEHNRARTKKLRAEKRQLSERSHLQKVAEHKRDTALTLNQQKKLRQRKLEDRL